MRADAVVYTHYSADGEVLYVGLTQNMKARHSEHSKHSAWWPRVARIGVLGPFPRQTASELEKRLTQARQPAHNIHNVRPYQYRTFRGPRFALRKEIWQEECDRLNLRTVQAVADHLDLPGPTYWRVSADKVQPSTKFITSALWAFPHREFAELFVIVEGEVAA